RPSPPRKTKGAPARSFRSRIGRTRGASSGSTRGPQRLAGDPSWERKRREGKKKKETETTGRGVREPRRSSLKAAFRTAGHFRTRHVVKISHGCYAGFTPV